MNTKTIADMRFELRMTGISMVRLTDEEVVQIYNKTLTDIPTQGITSDGATIQVEDHESRR